MNNFNHYYDSEEIRRVVSVIVLNEDNVLSRIVGLFFQLEGTILTL